MSLSTAPARTTTARAPRRPQPRPELRLVERGPRRLGDVLGRRLAKIPFLVTCAVLLTAGLLSVLVLNMTIAQDSYQLSALQDKARTLDDESLALQQDLDSASSSANLAAQASRLGMGPVTAPMFIDPETGRVSGVAQRATRAQNFTVVTGREAVAPMVTSTRGATDPTTSSAGLGLGGGLVGAVASLATN